MSLTKEYLNEHPSYIFVVDGNIQHLPEPSGFTHKDVFLFITKKDNTTSNEAMYTLEEYKPIFEKELTRLENSINMNPNKEFFITRLAQDVNKHSLFEKLMYEAFIQLEKKYDNVNLLF